MDSKIFSQIVQTTIEYHQALPKIPVGVTASIDTLKSQVDSILPDLGESPEVALQKLITGVKDGLTSSTLSRYFGFVIGGSTPVSIAADWLTSVWDQNAQTYDTSPALLLKKWFRSGCWTYCRYRRIAALVL